MRVFILLIFMSFNNVAWSSARVGEKAPEFSVLAANGQSVKLSELIATPGNHVVLEWHNPGCPYVKKYYQKGNMQALQEEFSKKPVKWLTIISSAKGKEGYLNPDEAKKYQDEIVPHSTLIIDADGSLGKLYGAKRTPHMFVINDKGLLVYKGAIDSTPSTDTADITAKSNQRYLVTALSDSLAGKNGTKENDAYGCGVKY